MTSISYPFTNAANYTFDPAAIEIVSDKAQLILSSAGGQVFNEDFTDNPYKILLSTDTSRYYNYDPTHRSNDPRNPRIKRMFCPCWP